MSSKYYNIYGTVLLIMMGYVHLVGWTTDDVDELAQVPRSVRSNPGSYRSHYSTHIHYAGGK